MDVLPLGGVSCLISPGLSFLSSLVESLNSRAMTLSSVLGGASMVSHRRGSVAVGAQSHRPRGFCNRRSRDELGHIVLGFFGKTSFDCDEIPIVVDAMLLVRVRCVRLQHCNSRS